MALPVWGNLQKSQIDPEKIEKAITRLIQAHEDDPNAHVEVGESLHSHKASEIIDHLVKSIIQDKLKDFIISQSKIYFAQLELHPEMESLDAWSEAGAGTTSLYLGSIVMWSGAALNNYRKLEGMSDYLGLVHDTRNPVFEAMVCFPAITNQIGYFGYGEPATYFVGFRVNDGTLYARLCINEVVHETEISGIDITDNNTYRIVATSGEKFEFYVNDVLKHTDEHLFPADSELITPFYFKIQNTVAAQKRLVIANIRFFCDK